MIYSKSKEIQKVVKDHIRQGWRYEPGKKHGKLVAPNGRKALIPFTPSDWRAARNFRSQLRRATGIKPSHYCQKNH
ncbi:hypothetical protein [uncultured Halomonas sp.]|jgi:hypothetical protein|uniref:hypothetical protein n=1 Tax=uncultured Halomonas sp. TaxID=173971 RepID=UPI002608EB21|nr:hypothetical protein [uncultured Halomonas sp.]